jgi:predicted XRE-type DNA-binding protein
MKKKTRAVVARTAGELAEVLGLERADGIEIAVRSALNTKIIRVIEKRGLTHAEVATLAGTSRTRITALLNRNTKDISTDLMLRVLGAWSVREDHIRTSGLSSADPGDAGFPLRRIQEDQDDSAWSMAADSVSRSGLSLKGSPLMKNVGVEMTRLSTPVSSS